MNSNDHNPKWYPYSIVRFTCHPITRDIFDETIAEAKHRLIQQAKEAGNPSPAVEISRDDAGSPGMLLRVVKREGDQ